MIHSRQSGKANGEGLDGRDRVHVNYLSMIDWSSSETHLYGIVSVRITKPIYVGGKTMDSVTAFVYSGLFMKEREKYSCYFLCLMGLWDRESTSLINIHIRIDCREIWIFYFLSKKEDKFRICGFLSGRGHRDNSKFENRFTVIRITLLL